MTDSNIPKSCSYTKPIVRKDHTSSIPSCSGSSIKVSPKDAGKSISAHTPRDVGTLKKVAETKSANSTARKGVPMAEAEVIAVQKKVERLMGRNDLLKKKLETSREEVKLKKEQSRNYTNDLKAKIRMTKEKTIETIHETEVLEIRGKNLEEEIKRRTLELEEKNRQFALEEVSLEKKLSKDKSELMRLGKMMNTIYRMTKELAQVMMGRLKKEGDENLTWRMYSWMKSFWRKPKRDDPVDATVVG